MAISIDVVCQGCSLEKQIQRRMLKIRNITIAEYLCSKCLPPKKKSTAILRVLVHDGDKTRKMASNYCVDIKCDFCFSVCNAKLSSVYGNLKTNCDKYKCAKCSKRKKKKKPIIKKISSKEIWRKNRTGIETAYELYGRKGVQWKFGVSEYNVYTALKHLGIQTKKNENSNNYKSISKELLEDLYYNHKMSIGDISKRLEFPNSSINKLFKMHSIKMRTKSEESLIRSDEISRRMKELWKDDAYISKQSKGHASIKEKFNELSKNQLGRISNIQKVLYSILTDLDIEYEPEYSIGHWVFDCYIPSHNLLIECQGEYWHSLPKAISRDKAKATYILKYHQDKKLICIWEHEFKCKNRIVDLIRYLCNIDHSIEKFRFSALKIEKIDRNESNIFLSKYHYASYISKSGVFLLCQNKQCHSSSVCVYTHY